MGPVNWVAVIVAAALAVVLGIVWYGAIFRAPRRHGQRRRGDSAPRSWIGTGVVLLLGAAMMGHAYARIGVETLAAKPWLYFMQSGGIAGAFIVPAVWLTQANHGAPLARRVIDAGFWLVAYLAIGATFWVLG